MCSGSYVGADMISDLKDESFASEVLHYRWEGPLPSATHNQIKGMRSKATIKRTADKYGYGLTVDGKFGPKTENAVKQFQASKGLIVTGICSEGTWDALLPGETPAQKDDSEKDPAPISDDIEGLIVSKKEWNEILSLVNTLQAKLKKIEGI